MKASEMIEGLQALIEKHGDLELIYSRDDEGNGFQKVYFGPTVGHFESEGRYGDFMSEDNINEEYVDGEIEDKSEYPLNSICIN